jgi:hypothetical protein
MKQLVTLICMALLIASCAGIGLKPVQECIVDKPDGTQVSLTQFCADVEITGETSYICGLEKEYQFDPCVIHRGMEVVSKEGLILEGYTFEEFEEWASYVNVRLESGMNYNTLKTIILTQFTKVNKMVGAQILVFGDMFLQMPQDVLMPKADIILAISSINDLVEEVKELSIWI